MRRRHALLGAALLLGGLGVAGCAAKDPDAVPKARALDSAQVEARLQRYAFLVRRLDHAGVASLFAPDGRYLAPGRAPVLGPAAIESTLRSEAPAEVIANEVVAETTRAGNDAARQAGTWRETRREEGGVTTEARGRFVVTWARDNSGEWLIRTLERMPAQ